MFFKMQICIFEKFIVAVFLIIGKFKFYIVFALIIVGTNFTKYPTDFINHSILQIKISTFKW